MTNAGNLYLQDVRSPVELLTFRHHLLPFWLFPQPLFLCALGTLCWSYTTHGLIWWCSSWSKSFLLCWTSFDTCKSHAYNFLVWDAPLNIPPVPMLMANLPIKDKVWKWPICQSRTRSGNDTLSNKCKFTLGRAPCAGSKVSRSQQDWQWHSGFHPWCAWWGAAWHTSWSAVGSKCLHCLSVLAQGPAVRRRSWRPVCSHSLGDHLLRFLLRKQLTACLQQSKQLHSCKKMILR